MLGDKVRSTVGTRRLGGDDRRTPQVAMNPELIAAPLRHRAIAVAADLGVVARQPDDRAPHQRRRR
jgi:hypothetical protein